MARDALAGLAVGDLILGGAERSDSVLNGLQAIGEGAVLVHDAARPFCPPAVVDRLLAALDGNDGAVPVLPVADTLALGDDIPRQPGRSQADAARADATGISCGGPHLRL